MEIHFIAAVALLISGHIFKNFRWKQIISAYEEVDNGNLLKIMAAGQGMNMVFPFRMGDLFRIIYLGEKYLKNGIVLALASVAADWFIDTVTVGAAFTALYMLRIHPDEVYDMAVAYGILSLIVFILTGIIIFKKKLVKKAVYKAAAVFNETIEQNLLLTTYTVIASIKKLFYKNKIVSLIFLTAVTWCCYFLSYGLFALFLQQMGFEFTLTRVFKVVFSMPGTSLLLECIKGENGLGWTVWFFIYLLLPLCIIGSWAAARQCFAGRQTMKYKHRSILPQLKPSQRLAFLSIYFNNDESGYFDSYLAINKDVSVLEDYSAGSNATTILCMDGEGMFFRKYAFGEDGDKLWKQQEWLEKYNNTLPLARVIHRKKTDQYACYDMEYSNESMGFFRFIHASSAFESWKILEEVLSCLEHKLYSINNHSCRIDELMLYIETKVENNIKICEQWAKSEINGLWEWEKVYINGVPYNNLNYYTALLSKNNLVSVFKNDTYGEIHGDLTIENIVCRHGRHDRGWYLIDPNNGGIHETPYLDLAKLLQSLHGRYEFLMMVDSVEITNNHIEFLHTCSAAYEQLYKRYKKYLENKYSNHALKSIYYHEVVHWLRLMPYKIKKNPKTAVIFYAGLLMVLDDVERNFNDKR